MFRTFVERRGAARRGGGRPAIEFSTNYLRASFFSAGEPESFRTGPRLRDANDRATLLFLFYLPVISWKRNYRNTGTLFNRALSITKASCIKEFLRLPNRCRHRDRFIGNSLSRTFRNEPRALCGRASWSLKKAKKKKKKNTTARNSFRVEQFRPSSWQLTVSTARTRRIATSPALNETTGHWETPSRTVTRVSLSLNVQQ